MTIGDKLREARIEKNLSIKDLARQTRLSASALASWECDVNYPALKNMIPLCKVLGIKLRDVIDEPALF